MAKPTKEDPLSIGQFTLTGLPSIVSEPPQTWSRIHNKKFGATQFNPIKASARFTSFSSNRVKAVPNIYASNTDRGAICEVLLRNVPIPSDGTMVTRNSVIKEDFVLSKVQTPQLNLINLTQTGLRASGLVNQNVFFMGTSIYEDTQALARYLYHAMPKAHGLLWMSVQDTQSKAIVLFEPRIQADQLKQVGQSTPVKTLTPTIESILDEMGVALM